MHNKISVLAATAALAFGAAAAHAEGVSIKGAVDLGLTLTHAHHGKTKFSMTPDNYVGSEFGLFGEELLDGGNRVGFALRSRFNPDTGAFQTAGGLFDYESQIYLKGDWGQLGAGRMSPFTASTGSQGWMMDFDAFEAGYQDAGLQATQQTTWAAYDNALYYVTPSVSGLKAGVFYSLQGDTRNDGSEKRQSANNRYWNVALRYDGEKLSALLAAEGEIRASGTTLKDGQVYRAAVRCDFGPFKLLGGYSRAEHQNKYAYAAFEENFYDTTGLSEGLSSDQAWLGVRIPAGQIEYVAQYQFLRGRNKDKDERFKRHVLAAGGYYYLSRRTILYANVSKSIGSGALSVSQGARDTNYIAMQAGVTHFF